MLYFFEEATPKAGINLTDKIKEFRVDGNKIVFLFQEDNRQSYISGDIQGLSPKMVNVGQKPVTITFPDAETANKAFSKVATFCKVTAK